MILNIQQTKSNFNMEWVVHHGDTQYAAVAAPFENGRFRAEVGCADGAQYTLYYNPYDTTWGKKLSDKLSFKVLQNGAFVGKILGQTKSVGFLKSYPYYRFDFNNETYYGYEVGFGSRGLYLCIYKGDEQIAVVDKALRVINFKDCYTAYLLDEQYAKIVTMLTVYYDIVAYGDLMEVALVSVKERRVNTIQKDLIAKFDPEFIPRVMAAEGI